MKRAAWITAIGVGLCTWLGTAIADKAPNRRPVASQSAGQTGETKTLDEKLSLQSPKVQKDFVQRHPSGIDASAEITAMPISRAIPATGGSQSLDEKIAANAEALGLNKVEGETPIQQRGVEIKEDKETPGGVRPFTLLAPGEMSEKSLKLNTKPSSGKFADKASSAETANLVSEYGSVAPRPTLYGTKEAASRSMSTPAKINPDDAALSKEELWNLTYRPDPQLAEQMAQAELYNMNVARGGDCNNNGIPDGQDVQPGGVKTATINVTPPALILDGATTTNNYTETTSGTIYDLNVGLNITHTWVGDLGVTLSHGGTSVLLLNRICGNFDNFSGTILDDEASAPIASSCAPGFVGSFRPSNPLSAFDGLDKNGLWTLSIQDFAGGDTGSLNSWSLIYSNDPPFSEDCNDDAIPDECQLDGNDCNENGVPDDCDVAGGDADCNGNDVPDGCEPLDDCDGNGIPDICDDDCNDNGIADSCDIFDGTSEDCQPDGIPDECQLGAGVRGGVVLINQPPNQSNGIFSDTDCNFCGGGVQSLAENFILTSQQSIGTITMYGGYFPGNNPGAGDDFTVIFHANDGSNLPGAALATQAGVASARVTTGVVLFGVSEYFHTLTLSPAVTLPAGTYFVEVYNNTAGNPDSYFWEVGNLDVVSGIQGQAFAFTTPGSGWAYDAVTDMAYSMITGSGGGGGADCNENGIPDDCDIADGTSTDLNDNGVPDECEDCNGNGIPDDLDLLPGDQDIKTVEVTDVNTAIPDCDGLTNQSISSSAVNSTECGAILDLDVHVNITHTWVGDLVVSLTHEDTGTSAVLMSRIGLGETDPTCLGGQCCGNSTDNVNVTFDDEAGTSIEGAGTANGTFRPAPGMLSAFDGEDKCGTWTLTVSDNAGGDTGTLNSWSLIFLNGETPPFSQDCNGNDLPDECDIASGDSDDCQPDGIPDDCQLDNNDCNANEIPDDCEVLDDCDGNGVPDICEPDCNGNGVADPCDIINGTSEDCQPDNIPDECQLGAGVRGIDPTGSVHCQLGIQDDTGVGSGGLLATGSSIPQGWIAADDVTLAATTTIGRIDWQNVYFGGASNCPGADLIRIRIWSDAGGAPGTILQEYNDIAHTKNLADRAPILGSNPVYDFSANLNPGFQMQGGTRYWVSIEGDASVGGCAGNYGWLASPDAPPGNMLYVQDTGGGWVPGDADLALCLFGGGGGGGGADCNGNGIPDDCDVADGTSLDCNENIIPDECEDDCNENGIPDDCDIADGTSTDLNDNGLPDECEDCNGNGIPDDLDLLPGGGTPKEYQIPAGVLIPDNNATGVSQTFTVPDFGTISDLNVGVVISHTWNGDIIARLAHGGVTVTMIDRPGFSGSGFGFDNDGYDVILDDSAGVAIETFNSGGGPVVGTFRPNEALSAFNGMEKNGDWTITVSDHAGFDSGALENWALYFLNNAGEPFSQDCNGNNVPDECDICDDGSADQQLETYSRDPEPNLPIFDLTDTVDMLNVGVSQIIADVNVQVNITHTWVSDLTIRIAHGSTTVTLASGVGGSGDNFNNTIFDDEAATPIGSGTAPFAGSFRPAQALSAFDGQDAIGDWTLTVRDNVNADTGSLNSWSITVLSGETCSNDCQPDGIPDECQIEDFDCNGNAIPDDCEGLPDCDGNGVPDECEEDCNENGIADPCDILDGTSEDCQPDGIPDECQLGAAVRGGTVLINQPPNQSNGIFSDTDCNFCGGGVQSLAENFILTSQQTIGTITMYSGYFPGNNAGAGDDLTVIFHANDGSNLPGAVLAMQAGVASTRAQTGVVLFGVNEYLHTLTLSPAVTLPAGTYFVEIYNNTAGNPDSFFWEVGNLDGVNGIAGQAFAFTTPGSGWAYDAITDMAFTMVTGSGGAGGDCNENGIPDDCDIADGTSVDCNDDGIPDECQPDCNENGIQDDCDIADGTSADTNDNGIPDECDPDCNGNNIPDDLDLLPFGGTQSNYAFDTNPNQPIANTLPPAVDTGNVPDSGVIGDVNVGVNLTHTWVSDLTIRIEHNATTVTLWQNQCGSADNINVIFDDEANPIVCGSPTTGSGRPFQPLSAFDNGQMSGNWTLTVADTVGGDSGSLLNWSLEILHDLESVSEDCNGNEVPDECDICEFELCKPVGGEYSSTIEVGALASGTASLFFDGIFEPLSVVPDLGGSAAVYITEKATRTGPKTENVAVRAFTDNFWTGSPDVLDFSDGSYAGVGWTWSLDDMTFDPECEIKDVENFRAVVTRSGQGQNLVEGVDFTVTWSSVGTQLTVEYTFADVQATLHGATDFHVNFDVTVIPRNITLPEEKSYFVDVDPDAVIINTQPPAVSTWTVDESGIVGDVNVSVDITHSWVGDMEIRLIHSGTTVLLFDNQCGNRDNMMATFDDEGSPINCAPQPITGVIIPFQPLSAFDGMDKLGDWTLEVRDLVGGDSGRLRTWTLHLTNEGEDCSWDCNHNGLPDECEVQELDCNENGVPDDCELNNNDCNENGIPDECEPDCNENGIADDCEEFDDCNGNAIPDECDADCNLNGIPDDCDIADGTSEDCQPNGIPDECDLGITFVPKTYELDVDPDAVIVNTQPPAVSTISVPESAIVADIDASVDITHTWVGDMEIRLTHGATTVLLWDNQCGNFDNMLATFDDEGGPVVCASPIAGTIVPNQPLSAFDGSNKQGDWTLTVADLVGGDSGRLRAWAIHILNAEGGDDEGPVAKDYPVVGNVTIPDNSAAGVTTSFNVPDSGTIGDLDLGLQITHTWNGDLIVRLSHGGTTVTVIDRPGFTGTGFGFDNDGFDIVLDDSAGVPIETFNSAGPMVVGTYSPNEPLAAFNGMNKSGEWTLFLSDNAGADTGMLTRWTLYFINDAGVGQSEDCNGNLVPDECDIADGTSADIDGNGVPDECEDCNGNNIPDSLDLEGSPGTLVEYFIDVVPNGPIPDNSGGASPFVHSFTVTDCMVIDDLDVDVNITHTWNGDLVATLRHVETNTIVTLFSRPGLAEADPFSGCCGFNDDGMDVILDDEASSSIEAAFGGGTGISGRFQPDAGATGNPGTLSTFDGEDICGTWTISVYDSAGGDTGTLNAWSLHALSTEGSTPPVSEDCNGNEIPDECDIADGTSQDCQPDGIPDECQLDDNDCNENGIPDDCEYESTTIEEKSYTVTGPIAVPDNNATGVTSTLPVAESATVNDVDVQVNITHTWNSDLRIRIEHNGTTVMLSDRRGGSGDNYTNTIFDDEAAIAIGAGSSPFTGSFRPEQPLSAFDGMDKLGNWNLIVSDHAGGDLGTINSWSLLLDNTIVSVNDCNNNGVLDDCDEPDCNDNGRPDECDLADGTSEDCNENGVPDECDVAAGATEDKSYVIAGGGAAIPDCDGVTNNALVQVFSVPDHGQIEDLNVGINLSHTWVGDLVITLESPAGSVVTLMSRPGLAETDPYCTGGACCGNSADNMNVVFDDEATTSVETAVGALVGPYVPNAGATGNPSALSTFDGEDKFGDWILTVSDNAGGDTGFLNQWSLILVNSIQASLDCNENLIPDECEADCNENGIPDDCDIADGTSQDVDGNGRPDECGCACGDLNFDGMVNLEDFDTFANCFTGTFNGFPAPPVPANCWSSFTFNCADLDDDNDVDLGDFSTFAVTFMQPVDNGNCNNASGDFPQ